jgi:hypothetical protein
MIDFGVDTDIEILYAKYKRVGLFMPLVARDYNNSLAFNTRSLSKRNLKTRLVQRSGSIRYITGGRVLSVRTARFNRNVERVSAEVGGRVVPQARDPEFMARLEFGGQIPAGRFGQTGIPTLAARRGSVTGNIGRRGSVPSLAGRAVTARNFKGSERQLRAVAMGVALRERRQYVKMRDTRGRESLYRVKGSGRGRNRKITSVQKLWTLSEKIHRTGAIHWLSRAMDSATAERVKVFRRTAEKHIRRRALRGK